MNTHWLPRLLLICSLPLLLAAPARSAIDTNRAARLAAQAAETAKHLTALMEAARSEAELKRPPGETTTPYDPVAADKARWLETKKRLAPQLFENGKFRPEVQAKFDAAVARANATKKNRLSRPKVDDFQHPAATRTRRTQQQGVAEQTLNAVASAIPRLELAQTEYNPQANLTRFELWLIDGVPGEWWNIFRAPTLQSNAWDVAFVGPPDVVAGNVQVFFVYAYGQPQQSFFQNFLHQDSDYDGTPDGYEAVLFKTAPSNPDSDSNGIADGDEDTDGDGLSNSYEMVLGTSPLTAQGTADSDGDGLPDWLESYITYWTGVSNPGPWGDADGDGVSNLDEFHARLDPTLPDFLLFSPPTQNHQRFVEDSIDPRIIVDANYQGLAASGGQGVTPPVHEYFPGEIMVGGVLSTVGSLAVMVDQNAGGNPTPGKASVRWNICSLSPVINVVPAIPQPDSLDGQLWTSLLIQATDFTKDVWAEVNKPVLLALRQRTLEHIQGVTSLRIAIEFRKIQYLQVVGILSDGSVLRIRRAVSIIHTEATKLTAITMRYGEAFPSLFQNRFLLKASSGIGNIAKGLSWWQNLTDFRERFQAYCHNVRNMCDAAEPALLSITIQSMLADCPGWSQAVKNAMGILQTTPLFDPNPLGLYEGGGTDCE